MADKPSPFTIIPHTIPCTHLRGYRHSTRSSTATLSLAIKQYIPSQRTDSDIEQDAITIIATHANGIIKETYEPLWEEVLSRLGPRKLRGIWMADISSQGASGAMNEWELGDDPNYFDHSRDLLAMVNHFRGSFIPPVVGVGHSLGCAQLVHLSFTHPRLFTGLLLMEPVITAEHPPGSNAARLTNYRPDLWPSLDAARSYFLNDPFYKTWDPRALERYIEFGLRRTPTAIYPDEREGSVTLTTSKHQEAWLFLRSNFRPLEEEGGDDEKKDKGKKKELSELERLTTADFTDEQASFVFHRGEPGVAVTLLPHLQPRVLWMYGEKSYINLPGKREENPRITGTRSRASGGMETGAVRMEVLSECGHLFPLQMVGKAADAVAGFLGEMRERYVWEEGMWAGYDSGKSARGGLVASERWVKEAANKKYEKRRREGGKSNL